MRILLSIFGFLFLMAVAGGAGMLAIFWHFGQGLPDYTQLENYEPEVMTRVHASDGALIAEYAREKRVFVPISAIPHKVIDAFVAAEDKNFFSHPGIDFASVLRAAVTNVVNMGTGKRPVGASTITQQVAKNFLLTNEVSYERKIKEAILSFRIERAFSKEHILELYLNEIYLGSGSYGVAAAALRYFDKSLDELDVEEAAYLAALPKAPSNYHPVRNHDEAKARRNWVIGRMLEEKYITEAEAQAAWSSPLEGKTRESVDTYQADFFAEEVRRQLVDRYGEGMLYDGGLSVRSTVVPRLQDIADKALFDGLVEYDRRHGWRGPITNIDLSGNWQQTLREVETPTDIPWDRAVVLDTDANEAKLGLMNGEQGRIPLRFLTWARPWQKGQTLGAVVNRPSDVLKPGDVIYVKHFAELDGETLPPNTYGLRQIPNVNGGLVAMDPHTGRVLAMSGGFSHDLSKFNRATQARRQPGSAFKPFVYLAALDQGFTPSTLVLDAPFVIDQGPGLGKWKPGNYSGKFYGPSTMRLGIEKSRNLMTVRLAQTIGMPTVVDYAERFGIVDEMPDVLSMSLGAAETTVMRLTAAYAKLVNGGKDITPTLIDRIQDRRGNVIYRRDERECAQCQDVTFRNQMPPDLPDTREQLTDPASAFQMVHIMEGVISRGTGRRIAELGYPLAGKTGTTNDSRDAWFVGFSPDLAVGVYVGFDDNRSLGDKEQGASAAAPIWKEFMRGALEGTKAIPFRTPPGIRMVRVEARTGLPARPGDQDVIWEAFKPGTIPASNDNVIDGGYSGSGGSDSSGGSVAGPGGIY
ncbi:MULTISPECIES: penicillin-binding protein 1A [unclassified Thalassospira]|uniref:penicillin-binding protein 1A n=1 Tax=unclassified Thalassospira TaxID=2648997 RepID=UPI0025FBCEED|nr:MULTISPECIES: penicillin-binding protein 1A [unclassified Thalassospira]|tara:strand:+ start:25518 stop:27941 length:2424 start_codon:yes stop_codon:yes gene_type:complete